MMNNKEQDAQSFERYEDILNYHGLEIKNHIFFNDALTHNSFANENRYIAGNYQKLEFLGDAILQLLVTDYLYHKFPYSDEGELTKFRSIAVREETLAVMCKNSGIWKFIRLGQGEKNAGGLEKSSILSDVFESFTAAIYLDSGIFAAKRWLENTLFRMLTINFFNSKKDYKTLMQELVQVGKKHNLEYVTVKQEKSKTGVTTFVVNILIGDQIFGTGEGTTKKAAEQEAAKAAYKKMKNTTNTKKHFNAKKSGFDWRTKLRENRLIQASKEKK